MPENFVTKGIKYIWIHNKEFYLVVHLANTNAELDNYFVSPAGDLIKAHELHLHSDNSEGVLE